MTKARMKRLGRVHDETPIPDDKLREALRGYEREHAKQFKPLDCQCSYCKIARAVLRKEGA